MSGKSTAFRIRALLFLVASVCGVSPAAEPREIWDRIGSLTLEPGRAVRVGRTELDMGMGSLFLREGVLVPATPVEGRTGEMVFLGDGIFRIAPADPIEAAQLELFTGGTSLDVAVERVVLAVGSAEVSARLLSREPAGELDAAKREAAAELYREWSEGAERRGFGADAALLGAALGDPDASRYLAAWLRSEDLGDFWYVFDPAEREQVTLGQFVPMDADDRDERDIRKAIERGRKEGRFSQLRFEDLGDWDTWVSTPLSDPEGRPLTGSKGFESEHYVLDLTVDPKRETISGTTRVTVRAGHDGKRTVRLSLFSDLAVESVRSAGGADLPWFRSDDGVLVVLPEPVRTGNTFDLEIRYAGVVLDELEKGISYALRDTYSWYPRVGDVDRATYEATLRWPKGKVLLASGRLVDSGTDEGMRWERRVLERPGIAFSFEIGEFDVHTERVGHVDLTIGINTISGGRDPDSVRLMFETFRDALVFFEDTYGAYPLDHLTVATVPRRFSQGFPGFITLSHFLFWSPGVRVLVFDDSIEDYRDARHQQRIETIAHELSHQWWGNKVGWHSYRDQWLSEALATYSAVQFTKTRADHESVYLHRRSQRWKSSLMGTTREGRLIDSVGPVVLGSRLGSSKSGSAYTAVVYEKGNVVFSMLSRLVGEEALNAMLRTLADHVDNRVIETGTFLRAIERMSGLDLATFAEQFVYGTGIPEIYYRYSFEPAEDGGWWIRGKAVQVATGRYRYELEKTPDGGWFVSREKLAGVDVSGLAFVVPFQVALAGAEDEASSDSRAGRGPSVQRGLGGQFLLRGSEVPFEIPIPREPDDFWLDQRGEVLARFYCEQRRPKEVLRYRAEELAGTGAFEEAEELLRRALAAPLVPEGRLDEVDSRKQLERDTVLQDVLIHLHLAELYMDHGRTAAAAKELETAEGMLPRLDKRRYLRIREELRAHLAVFRGDYEEAYSSLDKSVRLDFPVVFGQSTGEVIRRNKYRSGRRWTASARGYALLAVAAHETGHSEVAKQAMEQAEERGADVGALRALLDS